MNLVVVGAGSSAGAHYAGQERAPAAIRSAGLIDRLTAAGLSVEDRGDVVNEVFAVDHANPTRRNFPAVLRVARRVAEVVGDVVAGGALPLILGGDCTVTLGVVAGVRRVRPEAGLFYFDGDADLATPDRTSSGVLDAMGIAHLLGLAHNELADLDGHRPLLPPGRLVLFGIDETDPESFRKEVLQDHPELRWYPDHMVRRDPAGSARRALHGLSARCNASCSAAFEGKALRGITRAVISIGTTLPPNGSGEMTTRSCEHSIVQSAKREATIAAVQKVSEIRSPRRRKA